MGNILLIDNDAAWARAASANIATFGEKAPVKVMSLIDEVRAGVEDRSFMDTVELALVDLEMRGEGDGTSLGDYDGLDVILPLLRRAACWIPAILESRYVTGDPAILRTVTSHGFDAVVTKSFFSDRKTYGKQWAELRTGASLCRIASLTGREPAHLRQLLDRGVKIDCGMGVQEEIDRYGEAIFRELLALLELGSDEIILDEVVQGMSGMTVIKATCGADARPTKWLLKVGTSLGKLDREVTAHRNMFLEGATLRLSVPLLWWKPVCWRGVGAIVYQFEDTADSFLGTVLKRGVREAFGILKPACDELYSGSIADNVIPRNCFKRYEARLQKSSGTHEFRGVPELLLKHEKDDRLDRSVRVRVGPEHGDLHARNILVVGTRPVLIDFEHYQGRRNKGIPILDIASLIVDLWAFKAVETSLEKMLSAEVLRDPALTGPTGSVLVDASQGPTPDEVSFFGAAVECLLAIYSNYPEVPSDRKEEIAAHAVRS